MRAHLNSNHCLAAREPVGEGAAPVAAPVPTAQAAPAQSWPAWKETLSPAGVSYSTRRYRPQRLTTASGSGLTETERGSNAIAILVSALSVEPGSFIVGLSCLFFFGLRFMLRVMNKDYKHV